MVKELNSESFKTDIGGTILVDFWAPWCGPCKEIAPIFEKLSTEFHGKLDFGKMNVDDNTQIAQEYGVRGIPCLIFFHEGNEIDRIVGSMDERSLRSKIDLALAKLM